MEHGCKNSGTGRQLLWEQQEMPNGTAAEQERSGARDAEAAGHRVAVSAVSCRSQLCTPERCPSG